MEAAVMHERSAPQASSSQTAEKIKALLDDDLIAPAAVSLVQGFIQKLEMLRGLSDSSRRIEELEDELRKSRKHASNLQMRLDGNAAEYRNEIQTLTAAKDELIEKNKKLRQKETELKNSMAQLEGEVADWKFGFFREKDQREGL
ncbi:unnamed protein product [Urochloa humidicola]